MKRGEDGVKKPVVSSNLLISDSSPPPLFFLAAFQASFQRLVRLIVPLMTKENVSEAFRGIITLLLGFYSGQIVC